MNCLLLNIRQGYANSLHFKCQLLRHRKTNWFLFHYILNEIELYHFLSSLSSFQLFPVNLTWSPYMSLDSHVNSLFYFDYYHYIHINTCMCVHKYVNTICSVHYIYIYMSSWMITLHCTINEGPHSPEKLIILLPAVICFLWFFYRSGIPKIAPLQS